MRKAHNSKIKIQNCAKRTIEQFKMRKAHNSKFKTQKSKLRETLRVLFG